VVKRQATEGVPPFSNLIRSGIVSGMSAGTLHPFSPDDRAAVLAAVDVFAERAVAPLCSRPEVPVSAEALAALEVSAREAGLLPQPAAPGWALWEEQTPHDVSLAMLRRLGRASAGVAYRFHMAALSLRTARGLGVEPAGTLAAWEGPGAFGKGALGALVRGEAAAAAGDVFPVAGRAAWMHAFGADWRRVIVPDTAFGWRLYERDQAGVEFEADAHGLAEAPLMKLTVIGAGAKLGAPDGKPVLLALLGLHALGAVAVALGAVESAQAKALAYAHERRQGGTLLKAHAAIRLLIADASVTVAAVEAMLAGCPPPDGTAASLARVLRIRAAAQPMLCGAANQCLQVFGGYGYMQDYGLEKIVRDCNALRLVGGSPAELRLHAADEELATWAR
jgi:alkylation response protein AidB-like acyl-CoA dehydrogenase